MKELQPLLPPDMVFKAETLLRWLGGLADKHKKDKMHENAWTYMQALVEQDVTNGQEILEIQGSWWEKNNFPLTHVAIIRAATGTEEVLTPAKVNRFTNPQGMNTPANSSNNVRSIRRERTPFHSRRTHEEPRKRCC